MGLLRRAATSVLEALPSEAPLFKNCGCAERKRRWLERLNENQEVEEEEPLPESGGTGYIYKEEGW